MSLLGNLMVNLGINTSTFTHGLTNASTAANRFSQRLAGSFRTVNSSTTSAGNSVNLFARQTASSFKDVKRIAQGIVISQVFYKMTNAIQGSVAALGEFSSQAEQAQAAFSIMFKDVDKAERFMTVMEDFAAKTPFTMQQSANAARKLLAYGFSPKNMEPIMNTLADASSASGDPETFDRVGKALGQIRTKGKLASQELLQLTEAGIPAFEILRTKLGLTADEMGKIGHLKIPADVAINAILKGMQERYAGAASVMSNTVGGMLSTIKDNALIIGKEAFGPFYEGFRAVLTKIRDASDKMRAIVRAGGLGALAQTLIPPSIFNQIQLLISGIKSLRGTVMELIGAWIPVWKTMWGITLQVLNAVIPLITVLVQVLSWLIQAFTSSTPRVRAFVAALTGLMIAVWATQLLLNFGVAVRSLFIVKALAQLVLWLATAFRILAVAMISSPWIAAIGIAAGALTYFGLTSKKVGGWLNGLGGKITSAFGQDPSKIFTPSMKKNNSVTGEFNQKLTLSKESLDKMGNSAKKAGDKVKEAGKKAKEALMSFDEVFTIQDPDENADDNLDKDLNDIGDIGMPEIPSIGVPEPIIQDPTEGIKTWISGFKDTFLRTLGNMAIGASIGAIIGGVIGGILGGPGGVVIGAKIGAVAGAIAGLFWDNIKKAFTDSTGKGATIGGSIGTALGFAFGGPLGAAIGGCLGVVIGLLIETFWKDIVDYFTKDKNKPILAGASIGAIIGGLLGGPMGAAIGAGLGIAIGLVVSHFWEDLTKFFSGSTGKGALLGTEIGTAIGFALGGPLGAALGAAIGLVVGTLIGKVWPEIKEWWSSTKEGFTTWWTETKTGFDTWVVDVSKSINTWYTDTKLKIGNWWSETKVGFDTWYTDTKSKLSTWWTETSKGFGTWYTDTKLKLSTWWTETKTGFGTWYTDTKLKISTWWSETKTGFGTWYTDTKLNFTNWRTDTKLIISNWSTDVGKVFKDWWTGVQKGFDTLWSDSTKGFDTWASGIYTDVTGWFSKLADRVKGFWDQIKFWEGDSKKAADNTSTNADSASRSYEAAALAAAKTAETLAASIPKPAISSTTTNLSGHAKGGVFNKEHIARFAEHNKAEAIIPLEDAAAMAPFVNAVSSGLTNSIATALAQVSDSNSQVQTMNRGQEMDTRPILYIGTLIADDRGLKELQRKLDIIGVQEGQRKGG
jgi:tape measure domain-containing protein